MTKHTDERPNDPDSNNLSHEELARLAHLSQQWGAVNPAADTPERTAQEDAAAESDQACETLCATYHRVARVIGAYYHGLAGSGVPADVAASLTDRFAFVQLCKILYPDVEPEL